MRVALPTATSVNATAQVGLRKVILATAGTPRLERLVRRHGRRVADRFVAGETLDDAVRALRALNKRGLRANTTLLGEGVAEPAATRRVVDAYRDVLRRLYDERLDANVALKLTHLGLALDGRLAHENVADLVTTAQELGRSIRIDMEESRYVEPTLRIYRALREAEHEGVGVVLQSYLYRSEDDLQGLLPLRPNVRLVKGAYLEPPEVAYRRKRDVDAAYVRLLEAALPSARFTAVATHDERLIERAIRIAEEGGVGRDRFEFQMLYGIRPQLQLSLRERGFGVRVATPYGPDWYPYLMRRLAERPANVAFFLRNVVRG
jgi:proline dehydrogenase